MPGILNTKDGDLPSTHQRRNDETRHLRETRPDTLPGRISFGHEWATSSGFRIEEEDCSMVITIMNRHALTCNVNCF